MATLLQKHAEARPNEIALADEFGETTWLHFNERVNQLINHLRGIGLKTGDVIAVLSGNRREYIETFAAAAHGGWLIVPINWHLVADEIAYILKDSGAKVLFADGRFVELAEDILTHENCPALTASILYDCTGNFPKKETDSSQLVGYEDLLSCQSGTEPTDQCLGGPMFYTSGTTGQPKGVKSGLSKTGEVIEVLQMIGEGMSGMLELPPAGRTLLVGPIYHSAQWAFSFLPLIAGSGIYMRHRFDEAETLTMIDDYQITNLHLVPTQFIRLLRLDETIKAKFKGDSLDIVWHGAAPCPPNIKRDMIDWWGPVISEYYGSTEGAIVTTVNAKDWLNKPGTLGKPTAIMEVMIIKDDDSNAAIGESGTIYVKNIMGGDFEYHNDPEKTAKAHLAPGVFTFGDIGYLDEDGFLYMSDRKIDMIISGGVNIYPAEIEAMLIDHPAVLDAAVFGIPNEEFGEEVKATVELSEGHSSSEALAEEIMTFCKTRLAKFKVPRSVDFIDKMPRHPTGKLLKRLLRDEYWKDSGRSI